MRFGRRSAWGGRVLPWRLGFWGAVLFLVVTGYAYEQRRQARSGPELVPLMPDPTVAAARPLTGDAGVIDDASLPPMARGPARTIEGVLGSDERFIDVLESLALDRGDIFASIAAMEQVFSFRRIRPGARYAVDLAPEGTLDGFRIILSPLDVYSVERRGDRYVASEVEVELRHVEVAIAGEVRSSLWTAVQDAGESPRLMRMLADVFAWDIDFNSATRAGDRFAVIVDKVYVEEEFVRYGEIKAAAYIGESAGRHLVVSWDSGDGVAGYFEHTGQSVKKAFLKSPLNFSRISSGFSLKRFHPILHKNRAHLGVDYAAPKGTPVHSIGAGRVLFAGWKGGNGKLVTVLHANGYKSHYAHLSSFARGVRAGTKVDQRQRVGRVGATGLATGPHLHFAMSKGGQYINPLAIKRLPEVSVPRERRGQFDSYARPLFARLETLVTKAASDSGWRP